MIIIYRERFPNDMDKKNPLVTIITPVYNRADLVEETINSVLGQDYPNIEYILLDDGSTDGSWAVLQKYKDRAVVARHANMGEAATVNKGFSMAKGEIIGVISSDDPLRPGAVKKIVAVFNARPEIVVVYPDWERIDEKGRVFEKVATPDYSYEYILKTLHCVPGPGTFFRDFIPKKLDGRDTRFKYVSDFDFWLRAGLVGDFARLPERVATFRVHSGSTTVLSKGNRRSEEHIALAKKIYALPDFPEKYKKFRKETFCSAYFLAWYMCGKDMPLKSLGYLLVSVGYHPKRYIVSLISRMRIFAKRSARKIWRTINQKSA